MAGGLAAAPVRLPRPKPRTRSRGWVLATTAAAVLAVAAVVATGVFASQSHDRGRQLKVAHRQLSSAQQQARSSRQEATTLRQQLTSLQQQLDDAKKAGQDLTTQNTTLKTCLTDIRAGDLAAAANDQKGVDAADQKASTDCPKADFLLGPAASTA